MNERSIKPERPLLQKVIDKCSKLNIPAQVVLELTYRCNLRCVHCYVDLDGNDELTSVEYKRVLDQLKAAGTIFLLFTGGEIMVRNDFLEIAAYARYKGFIPGFLTNCTLVTPEISRALAKLRPFSVTTSLYGATPATHESVTLVPGSFERTLEGIKLLVSAGVVPIVQTLIMKTNLNEVTQIKTLVERLGAEARISMDITPSKTGADFPFRYEAEGEELAGCHWNPDILESIDDAGPGPCKAGKAICSISPQGNVFPCPMFPLKLGNVKQSSFDSIWHLQPCAELRSIRSITRSDFDICNTCQLRAYCHRCSGVAYLESGHADAPSPSACRQAQARYRLSQLKEVKVCQKSIAKKPT